MHLRRNQTRQQYRFSLKSFSMNLFPDYSNHGTSRIDVTGREQLVYFIQYTTMLFFRIWPLLTSVRINTPFRCMFRNFAHRGNSWAKLCNHLGMSCSENWTFRDKLVNIMADIALLPCVDKALTVLVLTRRVDLALLWKKTHGNLITISCINAAVIRIRCRNGKLIYIPLSCQNHCGCHKWSFSWVVEEILLACAHGQNKSLTLLNYQFQTHTKDIYLEYFLSNCF